MPTFVIMGKSPSISTFYNQKIFFRICLLAILLQCQCQSQRPEDAFLAWQKRVFGKTIANFTFTGQETLGAADWAYGAIKNGQPVIHASSLPASAVAVGELMRIHQAGMVTPTGSRLSLPIVWPDRQPFQIRARHNYRICDLSGENGHMTWDWTWEAWEKYLDYQLMLGTNTLILDLGLSHIWELVWQEYGASGQVLNGNNPVQCPCFTFLPDQVKTCRDMLREAFLLHQKIADRCRELGIWIAIPMHQGWLPREMIEVRTGLNAFPAEIPDSDGKTAYQLDVTDPFFYALSSRFLETYSRMAGKPYALYVSEFPGEEFSTSRFQNQKKWQTLPFVLEELTLSTGISEVFYSMGDLPQGELPPHLKEWSGRMQSRLATFCHPVWHYNALFELRDEQIALLKSMPGCLITRFEGNAMLDGFQSFQFRRLKDSLAFLNLPGIGWTTLGTLTDHFDIIHFAIRQWHSSSAEVHDEVTHCNARYGACKTGMLLAWEIARQAHGRWRETKYFRAHRATRFIQQLSPSLSLANHQTRAVNLDQLRLALQLMLEEWEVQQENPLYISDLASFGMQVHGHLLNQRLALVLSSHLLQKPKTRVTAQSDAESLFELGEQIMLLLPSLSDPMATIMPHNGIQQKDRQALWMQQQYFKAKTRKSIEMNNALSYQWQMARWQHFLKELERVDSGSGWSPENEVSRPGAVWESDFWKHTRESRHRKIRKENLPEILEKILLFET
jgi:hypothetical protein